MSRNALLAIVLAISFALALRSASRFGERDLVESGILSKAELDAIDARYRAQRANAEKGFKRAMVVLGIALGIISLLTVVGIARGDVDAEAMMVAWPLAMGLCILTGAGGGFLYMRALAMPHGTFVKIARDVYGIDYS